MATTSAARQQEDQPRSHNGMAGATTIAAAFLLIVAGTLGILQGISALFADEIFVIGVNYTYSLDLTGWGWVHLIIGILAVLTAFGMFAGATWARVVAIAIASVSIIANFLSLPYYPWWAILIIAVDVVVIWAVATWEPPPRIDGKAAH